MLITVARKNGTSYETEVDPEDLDDFVEGLEAQGLEFEIEEEEHYKPKLSVKMGMKSNSAVVSAHMKMSAKILCVKPTKRKPKRMDEDEFAESVDVI